VSCFLVVGATREGGWGLSDEWWMKWGFDFIYFLVVNILDGRLAVVCRYSLGLFSIRMFFHLNAMSVWSGRAWF
jgi:hypothetical protein